MKGEKRTMTRKDLAERRLGDQRTVLAAMPLGQAVPAAYVAKKTGFSSNQVGALLRNALRDGKVERAGTRSMKIGKHWQMTLVWLRSERLASLHPLKPVTGLDADDLAWMAYWSERYRERLRRQLRNQQREAQCRSICKS